MRQPRPRTMNSSQVRARLRRRQAAERRFHFYGRAAILFAVASLAWLVLSILASGYSAFSTYWIKLEIEPAVPAVPAVPASAAEERLPTDIDIEEATKNAVDLRDLILSGLIRSLPDVVDPQTHREALALISSAETYSALRDRLSESPDLLAQPLTVFVPVSDSVDQTLKGRIDRSLPADRRSVSDRQIRWIDRLAEQDRIVRRFNLFLFMRPDSRDPERAGIASAIVGSAMILVLAALLALPIGLGSAIYLEEFAPKTGVGRQVTRGLEIMINNLAAIPSIVFGLLGLAVFINFFGFARSIPLVGGMVLALRMFPTLIIASRAALQSVPSSIVDGALSLGATRSQAVFGQKVPLAAPGMLTGFIIALAQALGETAPLLMIGMVAFVTTVPDSFTDPATALPVQIFIWSDSPERAWVERTSTAILLLLLFLLLFNGLAIWLRGRLQKRLRL